MSSTSKRVLISGASIAGPALAYWLYHYGWHPTVVEKAPALRDAGQNIDVRGAGREVSRRMGIEDRIRDANTGEVGTRFVDADGDTIAEFPAGTGDSDGATAELEILRGDLAKLLVALTEPHIDYHYGDHITAIEDSGHDVRVTFAQTPPQTFDLVIIAEGLRSQTRGLVFGKVEIEPVGLYMAYLTIPKDQDDDDWWRWYNAPGGRSVTLRPDNKGTTRATLAFLSEPKGYETLSPEDQRSVLQQTFADAGWLTPRVLKALEDAPDLYFEYLGQVKLDAWSQGRVALLGDTAYCPSPITGMGTSLALTGAYVLAGELETRRNPEEAFAAYESVMREYVEQAQKLPPGTPRLANPMTRVGIATLGLALRVVASEPVKALGGKLFTPPADKIDLPDYSAESGSPKHPLGPER